MTPVFIGASNPHMARIAPYADQLHALCREIQWHPAVKAKAKEIDQIIIDNPTRNQRATDAAVGAFSELAGGWDFESERFGCLPIKAAFIQNALEVIPPEEMAMLVELAPQFKDKAFIEALEKLELTGFAQLLSGEIKPKDKETPKAANTRFAAKQQPAMTPATPAAV